MRWTIAQVAGVLDTRPGAGLDPMARVAGVSIDSRAIRPGELFIAIHGPRHDGHTFVALKQLARKVRDAWGGKIAGITGSVGKTTTKEILAALLGTRLRILKSEGN